MPENETEPNILTTKCERHVTQNKDRTLSLKETCSSYSCLILFLSESIEWTCAKFL